MGEFANVSQVFGYGCPRVWIGQWLPRSSCASIALGDAWLGSEVGWSKSQGGTVVGGPFGWWECAAAWLAPATKDIIAGDIAAINATDSRAMIFAFIRFPIDPILW